MEEEAAGPQEAPVGNEEQKMSSVKAMRFDAGIADCCVMSSEWEGSLDCARDDSAFLICGRFWFHGIGGDGEGTPRITILRAASARMTRIWAAARAVC